MKTAEVYLEGKLVSMISEGARVNGFGVVPGRFIDHLCERASSFDCRMAGVLSMSQFRSPRTTSAEYTRGSIKTLIVSRAHLGAEGGL